MPTSLTRRQILAGTTLAALHKPGPAAAADRVTICAFSKHFKWMDFDEAMETIKSLGYDGVDLTVRPKGHVEPERVADDLPRAVETIHKLGLGVPMITTRIRDVDSDHAEAIIKTMVSLGIRRYRWGGFRYDDKRSLPDQLAEMKPKVRDLAALNKQHGVCAMYHTHSGFNQVGASMWDLYLLLKDFDPDAVSANYDIAHATIEGGFGAWINSARLLLPFMRGVAVKDFDWAKNAKGQWRPRWRPMGRGMVNLEQFLGMLKDGGFAGPIQVHAEYDELGGADSGKRELTVSKAQVLKLMRSDMNVLKSAMRKVGWGKESVALTGIEPNRLVLTDVYSY